MLTLTTDRRIRHGRSAAGFSQPPSVINGFSDVIFDGIGPEVRTVVVRWALAELPFDITVEIESAD